MTNDGHLGTAAPLRRILADASGARYAPVAALAALWGVLAGIHLWWIVRFRRGFPVDIDESGYLWFAFVLHDRLRAEGIEGLLRGFQSQGHIGPLLPSVTAVVELVAGSRQIVPSMAVQVLFLGLLVLASYGLGARLHDRRAGLLTALVVATIPVVADFVRTYHLVLPSTAAYTFALFALLASDRLRRWPWALAAGIALGGALLSRTMMVAFVPGLAVGALWMLVVDGPDRLRVRNLVLAAGGFAFTALSWYATSWRKIFDYLVGFGYGEESASTGASRSPLSLALWTEELEGAVDAVYLPLAAVVLAALVLAAAGLVAGRRGESERSSVRADLARAVRSDAVVPALVVLEGYLALTSTRNAGTGFVVPILPAAAALVVLAALRIPWRTARVGVVTALAAVAVFNTVMKANVVAAASRERTLDVPLLGSTPVTNGHGWIHRHLERFAAYPLGPPERPLGDDARGWLPLYERVAAFVGRLPQPEPLVHVAPDESLLNYSVFRLRAYQDGHRATYAHDYTPREDAVPAYRELLEGARPAVLLTTSPDGDEFGAPITQGLVGEAARSLGYRVAASFATPDGRRLDVWTAP